MASSAEGEEEGGGRDKAENEGELGKMERFTFYKDVFLKELNLTLKTVRSIEEC